MAQQAGVAAGDRPIVLLFGGHVLVDPPNDRLAEALGIQTKPARSRYDLAVVGLADGSQAIGRTVVIATGVTCRRLDVPRVEELLGAGVFYGAAVPEAGGVGNRHSGGFAAGDVRHGSVMRVASAVGEGASAVQQVHRYLAAL